MNQRDEEATAKAHGFYLGIREFVAAFRQDSAFADEIRVESLARFRDVLDELPDGAGPEDRLTGILQSAAMCLGFYLAWKSRGLRPEEAGRITFDMIDFYYKSQVISGAIEKTTPELIELQRRYIKEQSGNIGWPGGWVMDHVDGDGTGFDLCWNNRECGIVRLYDKFDAREFVQYLCALDYLDYPARGLGLTRTKTLVDSDCCDFRVKVGGETKLDNRTMDTLRAWGKV